MSYKMYANILTSGNMVPYFKYAHDTCLDQIRRLPFLFSYSPKQRLTFFQKPEKL